MYKLFVSDGVVLGKRGVGEANTLVAILTQEMGLVKAVARSARKEQSKLRYALEPMTSATYSFIRGKYEWKLTGAERGTITPIGAAGSWPVFADVSIVGRRVAMGAGAHGYSAFVDADALITAYGATVAEIAT